ncbi:MAG: hypothetical protein ABW023_02655 [Sphingomonas sp.]
MLLALVLQAATPQTAVDAERAFNAAAQATGQWTAFREFAAPGAVVFTPQPEKVELALPTKNPPIAVQWWPAESYVSCDGSQAVNTGPWVQPKSSGYFTTVWVRQADGRYKWAMDGGDRLSTPRALPARPKVRRASCHGKPPKIEFEPCPGDRLQCYAETSPDGTLVWDWRVGADGARTFTARLWNGRDFDQVIRNEVAAPK